MSVAPPSDFELLHAIRPSARHLSAGGSRGSHTEVFAFDSHALGETCADLAASHGGSPERARAVGRAIGRRFLMKVGNIAEYVVKLSGGRESVVQRHVMSEAFGPAGYNMSPNLDKVHVDVREAVREIPYFGFGSPADLFAPDLLGDARRAITGEPGATDPAAAVFLVEEDGRRRHGRTAYEILRDDPYFQADIKDFAALARHQEFLREQPMDTVLRERMRAFFEAPITVGARDVLRWAEGSRHPTVGWDRAEDVIRGCFAEFGRENFLPPEVNYYTISTGRTPDEVRLVEAENRKAAEAFGRWMVEWMPFSWTSPLSDRGLTEVAAGVLALHFDYPIFEVEPYSGLVSTAGMRLALRLAVGTTIHTTGLRVPERRNPIGPALVERAKAVAAFVERLGEGERQEFFNIVNGMLWEVAARGGIPGKDGLLHVFRRIDRTFYSFQERAQYPVEHGGVVEEVVTLEDLHGPGGREILARRPAIARKLVVFFVMVYRYFLETGHVPDLRPDDAGRDLFVKGIWGYSTKNVLIVSGRSVDGRPIDVVRFVDNKDQFKQYSREEDRAHPLGLAKHALRLVHPLIQPAMERSIGLYTGIVASANGDGAPSGGDRYSRLSRATSQVMHAAVDGALTHAGALLHDLIDDGADGLDRAMRRR